MGVFDIRGTHGSGKSWIMHELLRRYPHKPIVDKVGQHLGYHLQGLLDVALLGRYTNKCGGCDGIKSADEVVSRVRAFAGKYRHVLLEGILVSHTYKRYARLADEMARYGYTFMFLDTPLQVCITRVLARRVERGNQKPFDPRNVTKDWHNVWELVRGSCVADGRRVVVLYWGNPMPVVLRELRR